MSCLFCAHPLRGGFFTDCCRIKTVIFNSTVSLQWKIVTLIFFPWVASKIVLPHSETEYNVKRCHEKTVGVQWKYRSRADKDKQHRSLDDSLIPCLFISVGANVRDTAYQSMISHWKWLLLKTVKPERRQGRLFWTRHRGLTLFSGLLGKGPDNN